MTVDLSSFKVADGDTNASATINSLITGVQTSLNTIGFGSGSLSGAFAPGLIFDPSQIQQGGAAADEVLTSDGTTWAPAAQPSVTFTVLGDTFLSSPAAVIEFASIPATLKHLRLTGYVRTDKPASSFDDLVIQLNGDTTANYDGAVYRVSQVAGVTTWATNSHIGATAMTFDNVLACSGEPDSIFSTFELTIPHYAGAANNKVVCARYELKVAAAANNYYLTIAVGGWRSNAAINKIRIYANGTGTGANFLGDSRVTLYGS